MNGENPPGFTLLSELNIAIVGLGLMGGSLAMDLLGRCHSLIGIDNDPAVLELAKQKKIADRLGKISRQMISDADVVILAVPVSSILDMLSNLPHLHGGSPIIIDLGSTKGEVLRQMDNLPERFDPLGGHPMCGKEHNSLLHAEGGFFSGELFALCPLSRTSSRARNIGSQIVKALGAKEVWMDGETHDRLVAATSHLPYLAANVLAAETPLASARLVGPGFKSTTRVAETDPAMMIDVMKSNRDNILQCMANYRAGLEEMESLLVKKDWKKMELLFSGGCRNRKEILKVAQSEAACG